VIAARDIVPPVLVRAVQRRRRRCVPYPTYEAAAAACGPGYHEAALCDVVFRKTVRYRDTLSDTAPLDLDEAALRMTLALSLASRGRELNVLDFGGACGAHYFLARAVLRDHPALRWTVVETAAMIDRARPLEDGCLRFVPEVQSAHRDGRGPDVVFSSGALQYVPDPCVALERLLACGAPIVLLLRTALSNDGDLVGVQTTRLSQNGPGPMPSNVDDATIRYPIVAASRRRFEEIVSRRYGIRHRFAQERGAYWFGGRPVEMHSWLLENRT